MLIGAVMLALASFSTTESYRCQTGRVDCGMVLGYKVVLATHLREQERPMKTTMRLAGCAVFLSILAVMLASCAPESRQPLTPQSSTAASLIR